MHLTALALHPQAARGVSTATLLRQVDDEVPGFELKAGPPGSVPRPVLGQGHDAGLRFSIAQQNGIHSSQDYHSRFKCSPARI